jgi:hypothetical protein
MQNADQVIIRDRISPLMLDLLKEQQIQLSQCLRCPITQEKS